MRLVVVHSIPSPYRIHLFRALSVTCREMGVLFRVDFLARGHRDREHWSCPQTDLGFESRVWRDYGPSLRGHRWHLNPGLIQLLRTERPDIVIVGGAWDSLTGALLTLSNPAATYLSWLEGNINGMGQTTGVVGALKRHLMRRPDGFVVPGATGEAFVRVYDEGKGGRPIFHLPNLVDEDLFRRPPTASRSELQKRLGLESEGTLGLWPARLIPAKGILEFLNVIERDDLGGGRLAILGDGPLREEVLERISSRGLSDSVSVKTSVAYEHMPEHYWAADLFVLPSLRDQNPLSVVEALHAGLPLVLSRRAGNAEEAVPSGKNGWLCDPANSAELRRVIREAFRMDQGALRSMGEASRSVGAEVWGTKRAVSDFVEKVVRFASRAEGTRIRC